MDPLDVELDRVISRTQQMSWDDLSGHLLVDPDKAAGKSRYTYRSSHLPAYSIQASGGCSHSGCLVLCY
ncbi:hypothetical protein CJ030_MR5G010118 [Morella rubra]|uniref:Uncharacterized protein n=1 Tax=Morella rubra TaxID=262757 RepID=A0A6A1VLX9_9ROSI|nr:hypothetical protein CJ030_MR5G010118 [Morella rubra]